MSVGYKIDYRESGPYGRGAGWYFELDDAEDYADMPYFDGHGTWEGPYSTRDACLDDLMVIWGEETGLLVEGTDGVWADSDLAKAEMQVKP